MADPVPTVRLFVEYAPTNPPKPIGIGVYDGTKPIGVMPLDELRACAARLDELEPETPCEEVQRAFATMGVKFTRV